jgi:hypothetical protein
VSRCAFARQSRALIETARVFTHVLAADNNGLLVPHSLRRLDSSRPQRTSIESANQVGLRLVFHALCMVESFLAML